MPDETMIPASPGKAEAMRTFLARGGGLNALGRYRSGPMKDMTVGQAQSLFENHWSGASNAVKDKYARRAGDPGKVLSPWERKQQGLDRKETPAEMYSRQREARKGFYSRMNGTRPAPPATRRDGSTKAASTGAGDLTEQAKGSPSEQAAVRSMMEEGEGFRTASTGNNVANRAAAAMSETGPGPRARGGLSKSGLAGRRASGASPSATMPGGESPSQAKSGAVKGLSPLAQGEIAKRKAAVEGTPTGKPLIANPSKGVNRLTGLPFGYKPGDKLEEGADSAMQARADQSVKRQQIQSSKAAIGQDVSGAPKAKIATRPAFRSALDDPSNAFSKAAYRRTDEAIAKGEANVKRRAEESAEWNSPENTKTRMKEEGAMFTGRVKPVDQLVRERGTPSAGVGKSMPSSRPSFARARR